MANTCHLNIWTKIFGQRLTTYHLDLAHFDVHSHLSKKTRLLLLDSLLTTEVCVYSLDKICLDYVYSGLMRVCLIWGVIYRYWERSSVYLTVVSLNLARQMAGSCRDRIDGGLCVSAFLRLENISSSGLGTQPRGSPSGDGKPETRMKQFVLSRGVS